MKISRFILSALLLVGLTGCGDTVTKLYSDSAVPENYFNETTTLQGTVFDAVTGDRITDASLKVTLVRGTTYQDASVRTGTQSFAGDYALSGIPIAYNNSVSYRVSASVDGYQMLEAIFSPDAGGNGALDKNYNFLKNIYLFPMGATANDLKVNVTFNAEPVVGATVLLQSESNNNDPVTDTTTSTGNSRLLPDNGFLGSLSGTTDASGVVTFPSASLVLGGRYRVQVLPVTHESTQLIAPEGGVEVIIGLAVAAITATPDIVVNVDMDESVPGAAANEGLYILSASNADRNKVTPSGVLTIVFSRAVELVDETMITAGLTNNTTAAIDATDAPNSTVAAEMTTATDGLTSTLTLTPNFTTPLDAATDNGLLVDYSVLFVRLQQLNDSAVIFNVFALMTEMGVVPDDDVQMTEDF